VDARGDVSDDDPLAPELARTRIALGCALLFAVAALVFAGLTWLEGFGIWPARLFRSAATRSSLAAVAAAAQVIAGLLAIALTVVAIVIELAANRYTHKITELFVREPINIAAACFYVIATVLCLWISATFDAPAPADPPLPNAALWASLALATASLIFLLPYFAYVFAFVSPVAVVRRIARQGIDSIRNHARRGEASRRELLECIEELADVARGALEHSDQTIAMEATDALARLLHAYQPLRAGLAPAWFAIDGALAHDPDFVPLADSVRAALAADGGWVEAKVLRRYHALFSDSLGRARGLGRLIAIHTRALAAEVPNDAPLLTLGIRFFNSYLRAAINARDLRTAYYTLDQYQRLAAERMQRGDTARAIAIAGYLRSYALLGDSLGQEFLLETVAYDLSQLIELALRQRSPALDALLAVFLEVDRSGDPSPERAQRHLRVRRVQVQLATAFLAHGDRERAERIRRDLAEESPERLRALRAQLEAETDAEFWEFTDRGVNFAYLAPERRALLPEFFAGFASLSR
jgi:hypothetical protein